MALLPLLAVAVVWAVIVVTRVRRAVRERRKMRHWAEAMATLGEWGGAAGAGEPWCRLLVSPTVAARLPAPRTSDDVLQTAPTTLPKAG